MSPARVRQKGKGTAAIRQGPPGQAFGVGARPIRPRPTAPPEPPRGPGFIVRLDRIAGLTKPGLLTAPFHFQVAPMDSFRRSGAAEWTDFLTLGGPTSRPSQAALEEFAFRSLFVDYDPWWAAHHYGTSPARQPGQDLPAAEPVDPLKWAADLRKIRDAMTPIELLVGQPAEWGAWHVKNMPVTLRTISEEYPSGENDTIYFDLSFTEFRRTRLSRRGLGDDPATKKYPETVKVDDKGTATWKDSKGEHKIVNATLHKLSTKFYGSSKKWQSITGHARNRDLKNYAPGHNLDDYVKKHGKRSGKEKVANVYIPAPKD